MTAKCDIRVLFIYHHVAECVPYSAQACKDAAKKLGLSFQSGNWGTKGCYAYTRASNTNQQYYKKYLYYGTGGTDEQNKMELNGQTVRPDGFDCKPGSMMLTYNFMISKH